MSKKTILELCCVKKSYQQGLENINVLNNLSLEIKQGEIVALVGPSGCGKSTLLQIAGLLDDLDSGKIIINNIDCTNLSDSKKTKIRRNDIGFIYQFHHLLPDFTATENITIPQMVAGISKKYARAKAQALLAKMELVERAEHSPKELSGGEQQRVAIARAMANKPSIILADEPTGNLDPKTASHIFDALILQIRMNDFAMLLVTHDMDIAKKADRVLTLKNGKIEEV